MLRAASLIPPHAIYRSLGFMALYLLLCAPIIHAQQIDVAGARSPIAAEPSVNADQSVPSRVARGELPLSRLYDFIKIDDSALHKLPPLKQSEKLVGATQRKRKIQIGVTRAFNTPLETLSDSMLYPLPEGDVRVLGVISEGALFTRIHFKQLALPAGARLFVYALKNPDEVYGPYEGQGPAEDGDFWTPPVEGEGVVIEYYSPTGDATGQLPFQVVGVSHIFKDPSVRTEGAAGFCNLEVPAEYTNPAKAVGHLQFTEPNGEFICTGQLLNTQSSSFIPYLITANHCFSTQAAAQSLRVYWNYNTGDDPTLGTPRTDGANLLATGTGSDFTFVRLTGSVPGGLWYNGWTTTMPAVGDAVVGIHHPLGSHKRYSVGNIVPPVCFSNLPGPCQNFLTVDWSGGTTEGGSSGSELLVGSAASPRYVGNLFGGTDSCDNPSGVSTYGRFDVTYPSISAYLADAASCTPTTTALSIGQTANGALTTSDCRSPLRGNGYYADRYSFSAGAGQPINILLTSSAFDTYLYLIAPSGQVIAQDDDGGGGTNSRIQTTLSSTGTYIVEVTSFGSDATGNYALSVTAPTANSGFETAGLYNPATSTFFLKNTNAGGAADLTFAYGPAGAGWTPLAGDWNGDGVITAGLYNPATSTFFLRNANAQGAADLTFAYGPAGAGWKPIAGDWNGDGIDTIGLFNPATNTFFLRNTNSAGAANSTFAYGPAGAGWIPIAGDWNNDGLDTVGLYNPSTSTFFLRNTSSAGAADVTFAYGPAGAGWTPLAGDWNGDGIDTIGLHNPATSTFFLKNTNAGGAADLTFAYGPAGAGWIPMGGNWDGL